MNLSIDELAVYIENLDQYTNAEILHFNKLIEEDMNNPQPVRKFRKVSVPGEDLI